MRSIKEVENQIEQIEKEMVELRRYKGDFMSSTSDIQDAMENYERKKHYHDALRWVLQTKESLQ